MNQLALPITQINSSHKREMDDHLMRTQQELEQVMRIMRNNIERLTERGDKLNELTLRADALQEVTNQFNNTSHTIVRTHSRPSYFFYGSIILSIITLLLSIYYLYIFFTTKQVTE